MIEFLAEVTEIKAKRTASVDKEISIRLVTDNVEALKLQEAIATKVIKITIDIEQ